MRNELIEKMWASVVRVVDIVVERFPGTEHGMTWFEAGFLVAVLFLMAVIVAGNAWLLALIFFSGVTNG
jgi:hypothetical protein